MNVLLLALSTISGENLKCFEYQYGEDPCFDGYYQNIRSRTIRQPNCQPSAPP
mgnify:CR=1 FL=1